MCDFPCFGWSRFGVNHESRWLEMLDHCSPLLENGTSDEVGWAGDALSELPVNVGEYRKQNQLTEFTPVIDYTD